MAYAGVCGRLEILTRRFLVGGAYEVGRGEPFWTEGLTWGERTRTGEFDTGSSANGDSALFPFQGEVDNRAQRDARLE